jgi:hypothetical protein
MQNEIEENYAFYATLCMASSVFGKRTKMSTILGV